MVKETEFAIMKVQMGEVHKALMGNGQPGMVKEFETVKRHSAHVPDLLTDNNIAKGERKAFKIIGGLFGFVLVALQIWGMI